MKTIPEKWDDFNKLLGEKKYQFLIPINKVVKNVKKFLHKDNGCGTKLIWYYDGCDCKAVNGACSIPYCEEHWNSLVYKEAPK